MKGFVLLLCVSAGLLLQEVVGIIQEAPIRDAKLPIEIDITKGESYDRFKSVHKRQVDYSLNISTTVHLKGDTHTYGLVHWSGKPREVRLTLSLLSSLI